MKRLLSMMGITGREGFWVFARQFLKFGIVGISNTAISLAVYYILIYFGVNYIAANAAGFIVSVCNAYFWNSKYVFQKTAGGHAKQFIKTVISYGGTFLLSTFLLFLMVDVIGVSEWIAPLVNLCVTIPLNFILNKFWAFK